MAVALVVATSLASCAGPARFVDPEADLAYYERVGVMLFTTLAQDRLAGEKVADIFFAELVRRGFAQVVEPGQFVSAMGKVRPRSSASNPWSTAEIVQLGEEAGVQGIFMGTVIDYEMTSVGRDTYPLLSLELRLVDTATGRLVWSTSETRRGGPAFPLFSWTETRTLGELTQEVCSDLLGTLPGESR